MKKKVLFILGDGVYPFKTGGMEVFNYYLIRELSKNYSIDVCASRDYDFMINRIKSWKFRPSKIFVPLQLLWYRMTHTSTNNVVISFAQAHWLVWFLYGVFIRISNTKATVVIHHGGDVPAEMHKTYKFFFKSIKNIVAVSKEIKDNYDKAYDINSKVIYPLVPFTKTEFSKIELRKKYNIPVEAYVICMVGSIKPLKNPDTLIEAISSMSSRLISEMKPFALYAGDGPMRKSLEEQVSKSDIKENVLFLGNIPKDIVCEILELSDIYLIASDSEGTSVSLLEAMYNRKSIIVSRSPGLNDMMCDKWDCLMYDTKNSEQLKYCIEDIYNNPEIAKQRAGNAYDKFQKQYNYPEMLKEYKKILS